ARQFLGPGRAALATTTLLIFPGYLAYATSFMTDVPTLAFAMTCLALGAVALRHRPVRIPWLLASAVAGCLAFSIREFAIAALVAVVLAAICAEPRRVQTWTVALGAAASCLLLVVVKSTLPGQDLGSPVGYVSTGIDLSQLVEALACVSLALLPAILIALVHSRRTWRRADMVIGAELGFLVIAYQLFEWYQNGTIPIVFLNNLANQRGVPGWQQVLLGTRPLLFSDVAWLALSGLALVASVLGLIVGAGVAGSLIRSYRRSLRGAAEALGTPVGMVALFSGLFGGGIAVYGVHWAVSDRYYWPLVVPMATLLLYLAAEAASRSQIDASIAKLKVTGLAAAALTGIGLVAVVLMLNSFAFDSARWRAGEQLAQLGVAPDELDAGYEWVGSHAPSLANSVRPGSGVTFYEGYFSGYLACGVVSADIWSDAGYELVGTESYALNLVAGPTELLYLYRSTSPECAS
ncbi:MAG TPA: hypothetical protein VKR24_00645, partial [Candidatus Limnocylindrales bacterium]|nr:hypothetical protein [Candidatus Limnocylindrales bacterium]